MSIDFGKRKQEAVRSVRVLLNSPQNRAYRVGRFMFWAATTLHEIAVKTKRNPNNLVKGWFDYHRLDTLCNHKDFRDWLDFARNGYIQRQDDFLPDGWPTPMDAKCSNLLHVAISFARSLLFEANALDKVKSPSPRKKPATILTEIGTALDELRINTLDVYGKIDVVGLRSKFDELLQREFGLWQRAKPGGAEDINDYEHRENKTAVEGLTLDSQSRVFYQGHEVREIRRGYVCEVFKKLLASIDNPLHYSQLQDTDASESSQMLRNAVSAIRNGLKKHHIPLRIPVASKGTYTLETRKTDS